MLHAHDMQQLSNTAVHVHCTDTKDELGRCAGPSVRLSPSSQALLRRGKNPPTRSLFPEQPTAQAHIS